MNKPDPKVSAIPRALRVAFVLEDGVDSQGWLDAIFADCFGRDGGRQSLVVPLVNGAISQPFQEWLRLLDPDFVLLLTYDNAALVPTLTALLADTVLLERTRVRDTPEQHPRVSFERPTGLTSLSWLPFLKNVSGFHHSPPAHILDRYPAWIDDGLVKDNFGTLCGSLSGFPVHQQIGVRGMVLTPENPPENRWHFRSLEGDEVQDAYVVLENLGSRGGIATLGQLSNLRAQPHRPEHRWRDGFCLVVGDSFEDRISCWNAGLLFDDAQSQRYKTLRVPAVSLVNAERIEKIGTFLRHGNWLGANNGPARVFVRSHSLDAAALAEFVTRLQESSRSIVAFEPIASMDDCCPSDIARVWGALPALNGGKPIVETAINGPKVSLSVPQPIQLAYCAGLHPIFSQGTWYVDLSIDRLNDMGRFSNVRESWALPNRRQLVRHFSDEDGARIGRYGGLSVPVTIDKIGIEIKQPEDTAVFQSIIVDKPNFEHRDLRKLHAKAAPYRYTAPSDKGSYLQGLIGMFGSLSDVEHAMETHFWRVQFESMAAPARSQHDEVINDIKLRMKAKDGKLVIDDEAGWQNLAQRIVEKASRLKVPRLRTRYANLLTAWTEELTAAFEKDPHLKQRKGKILGECEDDLKRSLSFFFERGVMYRGHEWSCGECRHRNWLGVDALKDLMPCEVCGQEHQLPIGVALDFRMNEFFATCLREHDTITVAWAIGALRKQAKHSFMFAPQTALYRQFPEDQGQRIDRELDLICIVDGRFVVGEVKAGVELIRRSDIEDLAAVAKELSADIAVLASVRGDPAAMEAKVAELRALLPAGIEARGLLSEWNDEPSYYL
jgi:hypothetical protein